MDSQKDKCKIKVSCWKNSQEFLETNQLIFNEKSTIDDRKKALHILNSWKIRRSKDTPLGILCTLILLDVLVKDQDYKLNDLTLLRAMYENSLMKFINFASSFNLGRSTTMYGSANFLNLDSFLIDLRHSISHGKQAFNIDVFRNSHAVCMKWIKEFYWDKEVNNISDAKIEFIKLDVDLEDKLDYILPFYDISAELIHKNFRTLDQLENSCQIQVTNDRWPMLKQFMDEHNFSNFRQVFSYFNNVLATITGSKKVRLNPKIFFNILLNKCDYFMQANSSQTLNLADFDDMDDDEEEEEVQMMTPKHSKNSNMPPSIVNMYQNLIWNIVKNDFLKIFLDSLFQINSNRSDSKSRRQSAHFWIVVLLKSYQYYKSYCQYSKSSVIEEKKITQEIRDIYSYQLDADLKNVVIFVGTRMLPSTLKYSKELITHLILNNNIDEDDDNYDICMSLLPLVYPPLSVEQTETIKNLIDIKTNPMQKRGGKIIGDETKIYTVKDLQPNAINKERLSQPIWNLADDNSISWGSLPFGFEFKI